MRAPSPPGPRASEWLNDFKSLACLMNLFFERGVSHSCSITLVQKESWAPGLAGGMELSDPWPRTPPHCAVVSSPVQWGNSVGRGGSGLESMATQ